MQNLRERVGRFGTARPIALAMILQWPALTDQYNDNQFQGAQVRTSPVPLIHAASPLWPKVLADEQARAGAAFLCASGNRTKDDNGTLHAWNGDPNSQILAGEIGWQGLSVLRHPALPDKRRQPCPARRRRKRASVWPFYPVAGSWHLRV
jgi:hypothetical protein